MNDDRRREISAAVGDSRLARSAVDLGYALAIADLVEILKNPTAETVLETLREMNRNGAKIP